MPRKKSTSQRKYSRAAGQEVHKEMHKLKRGTATSGRGHTPVKSRAQAVAIGLSEARKKGEKAPAAPAKKGAASKSPTSTAGRKSQAKKASSTRKSTTTQRSSSRSSHVRRARYSGY